MPEGGDDARELQGRSTAVKEAWGRTNEDMEAIAEARREEGWEVVAVPAVHTSPVGKRQGKNEERFGLVHVIPDNYADEFVEAFEQGEFPRYEAYRNEVGQHVYLVTELRDPETETVILIASHYEGNRAREMLRSVREEGVIYTHAKTLDGTHLGSVRHEEYGPLVPENVLN